MDALYGETKTFFILFIVFLVIGVIALLGLFFAFIFPNRFRKSISLQLINKEYVVPSDQQTYLKRVGYYAKEHAIVVEKMPGLNKAVISLITKAEGSRSEKVIDVDFGATDIAVIPVEISVTAYAVYVVKADGKNASNLFGVKPMLAPAIMYGILVGIIAGVSLIMYSVYGSYYLLEYSESFASAYVLSIVFPVAALVGVNVGMCFLLNFLKYKGSKNTKEVNKNERN